jgi:hypothetical protein
MATRSTQDKPLKVVGETVDYEAWRPCLIAFYRADCWFQSATNLERGCELSAQDKRLIEVLQKAFAEVPRAKLRIAA